MDVEFSTEQEELRTTLRSFLSARAPLRPYVREQYGRPWRPDAVWSGLADLGVLGLLVPEADGGAGAPFATVGVALEELGRSVCPAPVLATAVGAAWALNTATTERARSTRQGLAAGHGSAAVAVDHSRRWNPATVDVAAAASEVGACLQGRIAWVPDAASVDRLIVPAASGADLELFLVDREADGVVVTPRNHLDGSRRFADVVLEGVEAEPLDTGGRAAEGVSATVDALTVAYVLDGIGAAEAALALAVGYATEREQFGAPIGTFQAVQHLCADMLRDLETTRAVAYYALWAVDGASPAESHRAATMAKAAAADALPRVGAACIQVHGGIGFTWEHDAHLFHKRLLTVQHVFGTADDHLDRLAELVCDPPAARAATG